MALIRKVFLIVTLPVRGVLFVGKKGLKAFNAVCDWNHGRRVKRLAYLKLTHKDYQYPPGSFALGNPVRQGLVSLAGIQLQAFPLGHVTKARRGQAWYIRSCGMYESPLARNTGLVWPHADPKFKSYLSPDDFLNYVSPVTGVPMYITQFDWSAEIAQYNRYKITADVLHIPQWIATPVGRCITPFFKFIHQHILLQVPRGVSKVACNLRGFVVSNNMF